MAFTLLRSLHNNKTGPKTFDDTLLNGEIVFKCQYFPCQKLFAIHMYFPYCLWNISIGNVLQFVTVKSGTRIFNFKYLLYVTLHLKLFEQL